MNCIANVPMNCNAIFRAISSTLGEYLDTIASSLRHIDMKLEVLTIVLFFDAHSPVLSHVYTMFDTPSLEERWPSNLDTYQGPQIAQNVQAANITFSRGRY